MKKPVAVTPKLAESLAIQALTFIAAEPERLGRFLALTGIGPADIRTAARESQFLAGVLEHVTGDEALLVAFAGETGIDPAVVVHARAVLGGKTWEREVP
jgi:Protein of unknown function (DUF3572)